MPSDDQNIASSVIDFLNGTAQSTFKGDEEKKQSIEGLDLRSFLVAVQCIQDIFQVTGQEPHMDLKKVHKVYKGTMSQKTAAPAPVAEPVLDKAKAEALKGEGNKMLAAKNFAQAIEKYTAAIAADGTNAVYYANRAAAYSQMVNSLK